MLLHAHTSNSALQRSVWLALIFTGANVQSQLVQHFMQVLNLYAKMMVWLEGADPTICVQTNTWTAAALQLAIQFYKVLNCNHAACIHACMLFMTHVLLVDSLPQCVHHIEVAYVLGSAEQRPHVSA